MCIARYHLEYHHLFKCDFLGCFQESARNISRYIILENTYCGVPGKWGLQQILSTECADNMAQPISPSGAPLLQRVTLNKLLFFF